MDLRELTKTLCGLAGPSGFEKDVYTWIADYIAPYADEVKTDAMGNLTAVKRCGRPGAKKLLLDAHMDEIGFIITGAEEGFLKFSALGGVDARMLPAREMKILTEPPLFGVVDTKPVHLLKEGESDNALEIDELYIDVGLGQEEAEAKVPLGTPVVYAGGCEDLGKDQICGKSLDDRACAAIILQVFQDLDREDLPVDLYCVISTQEEVGLRGAGPATWNVAPDYAIVVDVTFAQTPDSKDVPMQLGKGAAIGIGPNMSHAMVRELFRVGETLQDEGVCCQTEVCPEGNSGTNAAVVQISRMGVATALVSLPIKYMHTPVETAKYEDMVSIVRLLEAYIKGLEV